MGPKIQHVKINATVIEQMMTCGQSPLKRRNAEIGWNLSMTFIFSLPFCSVLCRQERRRSEIEGVSRSTTFVSIAQGYAVCLYVGVTWGVPSYEMT
jgi:hypothetical protein